MSRGNDRFQSFLFDDAQAIPNNPRLPLLWWKRVMPGDSGPEVFEDLFEANGWPPAWRYGIFPYPHFHTTSHEVLGIAGGSVEVRLGGSAGATCSLQSGDVVLIPAGVGHQNLGSSPDLLVVGAYPRGRRADLMRDASGDDEARRRIAAVPLPETDPVEGQTGQLHRLWSDRRPITT